MGSLQYPVGSSSLSAGSVGQTNNSTHDTIVRTGAPNSAISSVSSPEAPSSFTTAIEMNGSDPEGTAKPAQCIQTGESAAGLPDDSHLPLSGSSAMPDPSSPNVPRLKARVHQRLTADECANIPLSSLCFRPLRPEDHDEMIALHTEWFPVSYDEAFYQKSVKGELFSLVATYIHNGPNVSHVDGGGSASSSSAPAGQKLCGVGAHDKQASQEDLLGIITMSTSCEYHADDIMSVFGEDCATRCKQNTRGDEENGTGSGDTENSEVGCLAYILTLGVADGFRRRGLARELLKRLLIHVDSEMLHVQAIYLHVVTYNAAAVKLYEAMSFSRIAQFNQFYMLHGKHYDSFLYALYLHGGRPPWKWRLRNFLGIGLNTTWKEWVLSTITSLWRGDNVSGNALAEEQQQKDRCQQQREAAEDRNGILDIP